jgi:hypothetical protein
MRNSYWDSTILALEWMNNSPVEWLSKTSNPAALVNRKKGFNIATVPSTAAATLSMTELSGECWVKPSTSTSHSIRTYWAASNQYTGASGSIGTGDFTVSFYVYGTQTSTANYVEFGDISTGGVYLGTSAGSLRLTHGVIGTTTTLTASSAISDNTVTHIAIVRSGTTLTLYKDGVSIASGTSSVNIQMRRFALGVGALSTATQGVNYSKIHITNSALWTTNFTPPGRVFEYSSSVSCTITENLTSTVFDVIGIEVNSGIMCGFTRITPTGSGYSFTFNHGAREHFYILVRPSENGQRYLQNTTYATGDYVVGRKADNSLHLLQVTTGGSASVTEPNWNLSGTTTDASTVYTYVRPYHPGQILGPFPRG